MDGTREAPETKLFRYSKNKRGGTFYTFGEDEIAKRL